MKGWITLTFLPLGLVLSLIVISYKTQLTLHQAYPDHRTFTLLISKGSFFIGTSYGQTSFALPRFVTQDFETGYPYYISKSSRTPNRMWILKEGSNKSPSTGFLFPAWTLVLFSVLAGPTLLSVLAHRRRKKQCLTFAS